MSVTFSGSLDITGSLFVNGTAVSTGSGGGGEVPFATTFGGLMSYNNFRGALDPDFTFELASGGFNGDFHISQSGNYLISASYDTLTSGSCNIYFYPDQMPTGSHANVFFCTLGAATTAAVRITYNPLVSCSADTEYYMNTTVPFNTSLNITAGANNTQTLEIRKGNTSTIAPTSIVKTEDGSVWFTYPGNTQSVTNLYIYSGSAGTPLS